LTTDGRLPAEAYAALESLAAAGMAVVPITGRPAGWCDMIARFWPVAGVVGENGAFYFHYDRPRRSMRREFVRSAAERASDSHRLEGLARRSCSACPLRDSRRPALPRIGFGDRQLAQIDSFIGKKVDAIIIDPVNSSTLDAETASSLDFAWIIQYPPITSFASANASCLRSSATADHSPGAVDAA
jgi:hypothetical protein